MWCVYVVYSCTQVYVFVCVGDVELWGVFGLQVQTLTGVFSSSSRPLVTRVRSV